MATTTAFFYDISHAFQYFDRILWEYGYDCCRKCDNLYAYHDLACILDVTLYERDFQLYYEGIALSSCYGAGFDRNLVTERAEQERRS
jgi:hypothetical protein